MSNSTPDFSLRNRTRYLLDIILIVVLFALGFLFFSDALFPSNNTMIGGSDLYTLYYPVEAFAFHSFQQGQIPLWNPYLFLGLPQFAEPQFATFYPPLWLGAWLPIGTTLALLYAFHFGVAASGGYVLVRELGGRRSGALLAALVFAYGHAMTTRILAGHLGIIMTLAYLPWCLAALHWNIRSRSWITVPIAAVPLGLTLLAGQFNILLVPIMALTAYVLWASLVAWRRGQRREAWRILGKAIGMGVFAGLLAAIQLLPAVEFWQLSARTQTTYSFAAGDALEFQNLLTLFMPTVLYRNDLSAVTWDGPSTNLVWEQALYVGILPLFLIGLSWLAGKSRWFFWTGLGLFGLVLALGPAGAFDRILHQLFPALDGFRVPARSSYLFLLAATVLAGLMFDRWFDFPPDRRAALIRPARRIWLYGIAALAAMTLLSTMWQAINLSTEIVPDTSVTNDLVRLLVLTIFSGALLFSARLGNWPRCQLLGLALAILIFDLWGNGARFVTLVSSQPQASWLAADRTLPPNHNDYRVLVKDGTGILPTNHSYFQTFLNVWGFDGFRLKASQAMYLAGESDERIARLLSARYYLYTGEENPSQVEGWQRVMSSARVNIDELADIQPRGFIVRDLITVNTAREALNTIRTPDIDFTKTAIVETTAGIDCSLGGQPSGPEPIQIVEYTPQKVTLSASAETNGWLVFNDLYYPGWQAAIDGQSVPVYPTDYALRGLCLPAGTHTITFEFKPAIVIFSAILSVAAWAVVVVSVVLWLTRRKKGRTASAVEDTNY
jgi:hypothetical protein